MVTISFADPSQWDYIHPLDETIEFERAGLYEDDWVIEYIGEGLSQNLDVHLNELALVASEFVLKPDAWLRCLIVAICEAQDPKFNPKVARQFPEMVARHFHANIQMLEPGSDNYQTVWEEVKLKGQLELDPPPPFNDMLAFAIVFGGHG